MLRFEQAHVLKKTGSQLVALLFFKTVKTLEVGAIVEAVDHPGHVLDDHILLWPPPVVSHCFQFTKIWAYSYLPSAPTSP